LSSSAILYEGISPLTIREKTVGMTF